MTDGEQSALEMLIEQVGRFTEGLTRLEILVGDRFSEAFERDERYAVEAAEREARHAAKMADIDERLDRLTLVTQQQAETARVQADIASRLLARLERENP